MPPPIRFEAYAMPPRHATAADTLLLPCCRYASPYGFRCLRRYAIRQLRWRYRGAFADAAADTFRLLRARLMPLFITLFIAATLMRYYDISLRYAADAATLPCRV